MTSRRERLFAIAGEWTPARMRLDAVPPPQAVDADPGWRRARISVLAAYSREWRWFVGLVWGALLLVFVLVPVGIARLAHHQGMRPGPLREALLVAFSAGVATSGVVGLVATTLIASEWITIKRELRHDFPTEQ